jgi:hypothetical protein
MLGGQDRLSSKPERESWNRRSFKRTHKPTKIFQACQRNVARGLESQIAIGLTYTVLKVIRRSTSGLNRLEELARSAGKYLESGSLWQAYVAIESAILDVKIRYGLDTEDPPEPPKRNARKEDLVSDAKLRLSRLDVAGDKKKLLFELRSCRDALKAVLAKS